MICAKQVLDPEGVNGYALWGRLEVDESGRSFDAGGAIPHILNAYDEQATEAALRIRDDAGDGSNVRITAIAVGDPAAADVLKRCVAMGADGSVLVVDPEVAVADGFRTARLLAAAIGELGDVDLVLCGRQGSDYDQGAVPAVLAELLGNPVVTLASDVRVDGDGVRVTRALPEGDEVVRAPLPAVVSVSNEIGQPRYPSSRGMMAARRNPPTERQAADLIDGGDARVELVRLIVPDVQGHCEVIEGTSPSAKAQALMARLQEQGLFDD
ncbi:MAG: electron transfer flavoprotein subunit beta/FixA family protein [Dehalococcoidia bacterium]